MSLDDEENQEGTQLRALVRRIARDVANDVMDEHLDDYIHVEKPVQTVDRDRMEGVG